RHTSPFFSNEPAPPELSPLSYTTLFRSRASLARHLAGCRHCAEARVSHLELRVAFARSAGEPHARTVPHPRIRGRTLAFWMTARDRKSTRLNSSHVSSSYAVFCLKKKS